jgi:hypothetical protein
MGPGHLRGGTGEHCYIFVSGRTEDRGYSIKSLRKVDAGTRPYRGFIARRNRNCVRIAGEESCAP